MRESLIEKAVTEYAEYNGFLSYKFNSTVRGVPDRIYIRNGVTFFIEFKRFGKRPTPQQIRHAGLIGRQGVTVYFVDSVQIGEQLIDKLTK